MKIRIKFRKFGVMKFIGHLDVMRYFQKLLRRSDIPVAYTEGMSPHQIMSFAMPLGIGIESDAEYVDIEITERITSDIAISRMNSNGVEGIEILSFRELPQNSVNAMASICAAQYDISFRDGYEPSFDCIKVLDSLYENPQINVLKKTKKSEGIVDIKPGILSYEGKDAHMHMCLSCGSALNIKPELVLEAVYDHEGYKLEEYGLIIRRTEIFTNNAGELVSLDSIGADINE